MPFDVFEEIARLRRERTPAALATVTSAKGSVPAKPPARMVVYADGRTLGTIGGGCVEADVIRAARDLLDVGGGPKTLEFRLHGEEAERTGIACGGVVVIMVESLDEPRLILIGAGHVAQETARLAAATGFRVTVVDDRPDFAHAGRFPDADEIVVADLDRLAGAVRTTPRSAIVCMTRGHSEDLVALRWALGAGAGYVGVLGSRSKRLQFRETLLAEGVSKESFDAVSMPVGLDLGAETVPEIAVAIVAELVKLRRKGADAVR
ncbi:MAG TPA: XdhC/CoxI family protein [Planctomycetota bacterium]|nr:XdhC/CoxI family protein [Planctomycetota bacterium]